MFLLVILFGLSMESHVFILSRVREAYDRGMSTDDAVRKGYRVTLPVKVSRPSEPRVPGSHSISI